MNQSAATTPTELVATRRGSPVLGEFQALDTLWTREGALFLSEQSARWFIRSNRLALVESEAIAIHTGRTLVHPERFLQVAEKVALKAARACLLQQESAQ